MAKGNQADTGSSEPVNPYKPLRTWPAALLIVLMLVFRFVTGVIEDGPDFLWAITAFGPLLCCLLINVWWLTFSRARWFERLIGAAAMVGMIAAVLAGVDKSMLGPAALVFTIPLGYGLFALTTIFLQNQLRFQRTLLALSVAAIGISSSLLLKADGMWGNFAMGFKLRWSETVEDRLVAAGSNSEPSVEAVLLARPDAEAVQAALLKPEWAEFRGGEADSVVRGKFYSRNWSSNPPKELWRIDVGPAWSSFVVAGPVLFSQEQRGDKEAVVCYDAATGKVQWMTEVLGRFEDPLGGPGPRSTPTLNSGKLFAQGANGALVCIEPTSGKIIWEKDLKQIAKREPPMWGFSASPLVIDSLVVAYAGGADDLGLLAFDAATGELKWSVPCGIQSYSSPQRMTIQGKTLIALTSEFGLHFYEPSSGKEEFRYDWEVNGYRACQPHLLSGDRVLLPSGMGYGTRLVQLKTGTQPWTADSLWTSRELKPDFNDFVIYKDHIYGFDGAIFTCIKVEDGKRQWKGGRYGKGQVLLLEDSGLLLIAAEDGELVLVAAEPTGQQELTRFRVFNSKVWNHPVVVGDKLFMRSAEAAVCYQLPTE